MVTANTDDELMTFLSEHDTAPVAEKPRWRVLIVDDEPDVHQATEIAMGGILIEGRTVEFVHAYSAQDARRCLAEHDDLAVMLLDVVMETPDAGLQLVRHVREELGNQALRVILRTGQPGYAPEIDTIRTYDINDYKTKSELTRVRLFTSLTVAVRSYWQIHQLEANRRGLEMIVAASTDLSRPKGLQRFAKGIVTQLCALLSVPDEGVVCAAASPAETPSDNHPYILAAAGRYSEWIGLSLADIPDPRVRIELEKSLTDRRHHFGQTTRLFFSAPGGVSIAAFVDVDHQLSNVDLELLGLFCSNIAVAFDNTVLLKRISDLAYEDPLLKLPNRNSFVARIDQRRQEADMLALIDIDGFADINSVLDQAFGDAVLKGFVEPSLLRRQMAAETVVSGYRGGQAADHRQSQRRAESQSHRRHRKGHVGLRHGHHHRQRGGEVTVGRATALHHRQRRHRCGEAHQVDLQRGEHPQPGEAGRPQQRREPRHHPVEYAAGFEQAHQRQHDHHDRQQHEERQLDRRAAGLEDDLGQLVHGGRAITRGKCCNAKEAA